MPCQLNNHSNTDLSSLEPHVQGMYDYFDQKLGFNRPPTMHFDSDPSNQSNVLGKTAYYDPSSLEIHIFTDGRHPKDMLRSIAHELIHHQQNLEGRLNVGGYMGQGYYLKNEKMRDLEQEAMLQGNALMREYEDTIKSEEISEMSLKEWKNNELNELLLKKFGILKEEKEITHMCALEVTHKTSGMTGHPIRHTLSESGNISHYTVEFEKVIVENIAVENLDIVQQESHSHKRDDEKPHDEEKPVVSEEELKNPKKADLDKDGKLSGYEKKRGAAIEKSMSQKDEEMNEEVVEEIAGRDEPGGEDHFYNDPEGAADRYRNRPKKDKPEEKKEGLQEEKDDDSRGKAQTGDSPTKKRTGKPDPSGKRFADQGKGKPYLRKEGLQETLKRIAKAKNITLKSSGKKIK